MKIILNNGAELTPITVTGGKRTAQGASRDTLSFVFSADTSMDELDGIFTAANCENITIVDVQTVTQTDENGEVQTVEQNVEYIHKGYTVRAELKREPVVVTAATESEAAVIENRVIVSMGQRTYQESQLAELQEALDLILSGDTGEV